MCAEKSAITPPINDRHFSKNVFLEPEFEEFYDLSMRVITRYIDSTQIKGRRVVDLACGYGGYGRRFIEMGAEVIFIDGRSENLDAVKQLVPGAKTYVMNLESDDFPSDLGKIDLVMCMGLLYHTGDPKAVLKKVSSITDNIFVETTALDHDGEAIIYLNESTEPAQFSLTGAACRPSPGWLVNAIKEAGYKRVADISHRDANRPPRPGFPGVVYDWQFERTCGWRRNECTLRKVYLASKLENPGFLLF